MQGLDQPFMYATDSYRHGRWKKKGGKWGITDRGRKQVRGKLICSC